MLPASKGQPEKGISQAWDQREEKYNKFPLKTCLEVNQIFCVNKYWTQRWNEIFRHHEEKKNDRSAKNWLKKNYTIISFKSRMSPWQEELN